MTNAVTVRGLRKQYKDVTAVDGVDLDIEYGEILALIGPNGAGKTTTVEILEGHRSRDGGEVRVLGVDPASAPLSWHPAEVIELVGLTEHARRRVARLSGGQRRRLDVAVGVLGRPKLFFLDEPTTGFDPQGPPP